MTRRITRWADGAGHDAGTQRGEVEAFELGMLQLGDEHGGDAVEGGGGFLADGLERGERVEAIAGIDHGGPVGDTAEIAHDHAETV